MAYKANETRYENMAFNRCGKSGLVLPAISLGLWHNFGGVDAFSNAKALLLHAFDNGITHFDLANNYGPPPGSAEETFGQVIGGDLKPYRDELVISTKAGYNMWNGPYGEWGSRKHLVSSLDQSLKRMRLEYVDIFYHHRPDPATPLEETCLALDHIVRQGKALYIGVSNYSPEQTAEACKLLRAQKTPFIIHQARYSMMDRRVDNGLKDIAEENGLGIIAYSPLEMGLLTNRYLNGIPGDSRAGAGKSVFLSQDRVTAEKVAQAARLNEIAAKRGQTLAQMAVSWILRDGKVTSVLIGASKTGQIDDCIGSVRQTEFSSEELQAIVDILG